MLKRILWIGAALLLVGGGLFIFARPWWLGVETMKQTATLHNIRMVERPLCKYWQGEFHIGEATDTGGMIPFWVETSRADLVEKLEKASKTQVKVMIQYQKQLGKKFWACKPSEYQIISIETP